MKYRHPAWNVLGIEPTSDQRAIRVAYTAKLKAIDPEVDPQAFIELREAFDAARVQAQWVDLPDDGEEDWDADWDYDPDAEPEGGYSYSPITGMATPAAESAADDKYRALADFLLPGGERRTTPLSDEAERQLHALFEAALDDPRMETIAFQADADRWFAEILARAWPASDAVLLRAARRFGWDAGAEPGSYITPAVDFINGRLRDGGRYGPVTDPAVGPATAWSPTPPPGNPLAPPRVETPEDRLSDTVPITGSESGFETDGYRVRDPVGGEGPRFETDPRNQHVPLPSDGQDAPPVASPWGAASAEDADRHARALAELLYAHADGDTYAAADQKAAMLDHWRAITADPRMQEIAYFADADRWFSELIARCIPFSDPLILPATRFFGWTRADGTITQSWAAEKITRRYAAIEFMDAVQKPDHPLNPAWRELTAPKGKRRGRVNKREMARLLKTVRTHYPDLEGAFDPYQVELWEGAVPDGGPSALSWIFGILFVGLLVARIFGAVIDANRTEGSLPTITVERELTEQRADVEWALTELFDGELSLRQIVSQNPVLAAALLMAWQNANKDQVSGTNFLTDIRALTSAWYAAGVRKGDAALLSDYHRLTIDIARTLQGDPSKCTAFLGGSRQIGSLQVPPELMARERDLMVRTLLTTDGETAGKKPGSAPVSGDVIDKAAKRAGRPREQIEQALLFKGPAAQLCPSRIAFMEEVLALPPKQRLSLMRIM